MNDLPFFIIPSGGGGGGTSITSAAINEDGELVLTYSDGQIINVGRVVGRDGNDGAVYVPHIDEHNILTFTIEEGAGEIPDPIDLNPWDEWSSIDESEVESEYVWEGI